ncbi:heavy metal RND efflux outer membrane protein, CzcC family [Pseudoalteromonas sp. SW0106-04]|uniref:TolC family protein n=1 Tax=Pseudoalteromonas sp. SW0106-04 TaxID=1702169 RepID=UPI0006B41640|nr:TolC family protein [Pseudoalteromonas sp. SW0106-04]GAP73680.1 heavy metal RND efflux outer membrane protein, CzcC family [Pseudoalteromonas sp. SW0106-04]
MKKLSVSYAMCAVIYLLSASAQAQPVDWERWLASQIKQHPDIIAAREQLQGSEATADAAEQPLYNPELSSELEQVGEENNYRVGVSQTVDWWDRRGAKQQQAAFIRQAAKAQYQQQVMSKTAEALSALVEWRASNEAAIIAQAQKEQLNALLQVAEKRQKAGDIGTIDAELTFLSLSKQLAQVAELEVALQKAESRVRELLPQWTPEKGGIPEDFWPSEPVSITNQELLQHPYVASAQARWKSIKEEAEATRRAAKAEPTFGVNAGRDGGENTVGLTFSIPLNVRNDYSAETRVANRAALEAEARFLAVYRNLRFDWQAAQAAWKRYDEQYRRWLELAHGRVENSADLLESQWRSGDLSTTDYLLALNQRSESLLAGISLEKHTQLALTEVLLHSGQLRAVVLTATKPLN